MANSLEGFFNNMAAAFTDANKALGPQAAFLTGNGGQPLVYTDVRSDPLSQYAEVSLQVPNTPGDAVNAITTKPTAVNLVSDATKVRLDYMPAWGFEITSMEQLTVMSPQALRDAYVDEAIKKIVRAANKHIIDLITTTTFNLAGNVTGVADKGVTLDDFTTMFGVLAGRDVPVDDAGKLFFVANSSIYTGLLKDPEWREAAKIGDSRAQNQIGSGVLPITYGALPIRDNQMPVATGQNTSIYFHRDAFAMVTAPLPAPPATVDFSYNAFGPLQILSTIKYVADQPRLELWFHALMGATAWRKTHAVLHTSTPKA